MPRLQWGSSKRGMWKEEMCGGLRVLPMALAAEQLGETRKKGSWKYTARALGLGRRLEQGKGRGCSFGTLGGASFVWEGEDSMCVGGYGVVHWDKLWDLEDTTAL